MVWIGRAPQKGFGEPFDRGPSPEPALNNVFEYSAAISKSRGYEPDSKSSVICKWRLAEYALLQCVWGENDASRQGDTSSL